MMTNFRSLVLWVGGFSAISGCGQDGKRGDSFPVEVRDSAGIRIVENLDTEIPKAPLEVPSHPLFRVGWEEGEPEFQYISSGTILTDGHVVVAESDGSAIFFFSSDGHLDRRVGGTGDGPGEYREIQSVHAFTGDSLIVQDQTAARGTVLDSKGDCLRDFRFPPWSTFEKGGSRGMLAYTGIGVSDEGHLLLWPFAYSWSGAFPEGWIDGLVLKVDPTKSTTDTLLFAPFLHRSGHGPQNPFPAFGLAGFGGGAILYARGDESQITWLDENGLPFQETHWRVTRRQVDDALWQEYANSYLESLRPEADRARAERSLEEQRRVVGEFLPNFRTLHADDEGTAWLGDYAVTEFAPSRYTVIRRDGALLGWVEIPEGIRILDISHGRILGVETNEWDVQAVSVYLIEKN